MNIRLNDAKQVEKVEGELLDGWTSGRSSSGWGPKKQKGTRLAAGPLKGKKSYSTPFLREASSLAQLGTCWPPQILPQILLPSCFTVALKKEKVLHPGMRRTVAGRLKTYRILGAGPEIE